VAVVLNAAVVETGGLCVMFDPNDNAAILFHAEPGRSLSEGTIIGGLMDAPEVSH
jgi:hypothetical protein